MSVLIFNNFLDVDVCNELNNWIDLAVKNKWLDKGVSREKTLDYEGRFTTRMYSNRFEYPKVVYEVQKKIDEFLHLKTLKKSVIGGGRDGIVVSCTFSGGDVYPHTDPKEGNLEVLRCNIMTRNADEGGELFVGNQKIEIQVGDLHCYLPSTVEHYVTEVKGQTPRVLWMFGYQCSIERFNQMKQL